MSTEEKKKGHEALLSTREQGRGQASTARESPKNEKTRKENYPLDYSASAFADKCVL